MPEIYESISLVHLPELLPNRCVQCLNITSMCPKTVMNHSERIDIVQNTRIDRLHEMTRIKTVDQVRADAGCLLDY